MSELNMDLLMWSQVSYIHSTRDYKVIKFKIFSWIMKMFNHTDRLSDFLIHFPPRLESLHILYRCKSR